MILTILGLVALLAFMWGGLWLWTDSNAQRRHDACVSRQSLYDGQFTYTRFLARELQASPEETEHGLRELKKELGPRPVCDS